MSSSTEAQPHRLWVAAAGAGAVIAVVLGWAPLPGADDGRLAIHMARHLLLLEAAPILLLLALRPLRPRVGAITAGVAGTAVIVAWHVPAAFDAALAHPIVHGLEHVAFLTAGLVLWAPVICRACEPAGALGYLVATRSVQTLLGNVLLWWPSPLYAGRHQLGDQRLAAALMLGEGLVVGLAAAWLLFLRLLRPPAASVATARAAGPPSGVR